jgi:uncharacterized protein
MSSTAAGTAREEMLSHVRSSLPAGSDSALAGFERLLDVVEDLGSCVLALSGGIDSSFLLAVAAPLLRDRCLAITADSAAVPAWDRSDADVAGGAAAAHGAKWRSIHTSEVEDPRYAGNPKSRCYYCKAAVYGAFAEIARAEGYAWVVDGTNASDRVRTDRPGMAAGAELGVRSPLAEAGIGKADLRLLARALGLPDWDRPASACLSSRIPFGRSITPERLRRVEAAELGLRSLGFRQVRVRDFGSEARVEVEAAERHALDGAAADVASVLTQLGYERWTPDMYTGGGAGALAAGAPAAMGEE